MKTLTTKKTAMIIVAAAMSMQSLGLKAFANEICESYVAEESTSVTQDKTQEQILSDAVFEAHQALMTKKALLDQALAELDAVKPDYESKELAYNESQNNASNKEETVSDELLDTMKTNLLEIQSTKKDLDKAWEEKDKAYEESEKAEAAYKNAQDELEKAKKAYGAVAKAESADQGELEAAKKAVEEAEEAVETAKADYESAVAKKAELEQAVLENTELLQTAKDELTAIEQKKAFADEEMGQLRFTLKQLQDSIASDTTDEQVAEKQALIDKYQAEFDGLMETVNNYAMEIDKL